LPPGKGYRARFKFTAYLHGFSLPGVFYLYRVSFISFPVPDYIEANPKRRSTNCLLYEKCLCADLPIIKGLAE